MRDAVLAHNVETSLKLSRFAAMVVLAVGVLVLIGWGFDLSALTRLVPGLASMKPNTALAFMLCGAALWWSVRTPGGLSAPGRACAAAAGLVAVATLAEYVFGWNLGIDQLLFHDAPHSVGVTHAGRMSVNTALSFTLVAGALLLLNAQTARGSRPAEWLVLTTALISFLALMGYLYGVKSLQGIGPYASMALHTVLTFLILCVGILAARPQRGMMRRLLSETPGGAMARRLLPAAILIPPLLGWLRTLGQQAGWYDTEFGRALLISAMVIVFTVVVWINVSSLNRLDVERAKLHERERQAAVRLAHQVSLLSLLDQITRAIGERQDLQSIFQVVVRALEDRLPIDFGCVCLYDDARESLTVARVGAKSTPLAAALAMGEQSIIAVDENGLSKCLSGQLVYEPDISTSRFPFPKRLASAELRSLVIAPLLVQNRVFGILVAARREPNAFSSGDCEFLRQLSQHVALASHQAQLYGSLQQAYDDLQQSQATALQQERLRALGQMASGIAHDINNAMSPAALYTESLLEREPNLSPRARDYLGTIQRAIEDVAQTVARMREFYRPRETQLTLTPVDLNRMVEQVIDLTRARWRDIPQERGVVLKLETDLPASLPAFMGAETEIRDSLTNLIFNAVDAMPEGGTLRVQTRMLRPANSESASSVAVEVCDTGAGMDEDTQRRCLEPFFTTKGERGTGLGLAMVYGMVQRHSAELEIDTERGKGTTMRLIFPVATGVISRPSSPVPVPTRPLRILLVDDDPLLIKSLADVLEADGHLVTTADGGQAGIDTATAAQQRGDAFEVVITDLGMPYVDGRKVAMAVRANSPDTAIVLLTGWGQRLLSEDDIPEGVDRVLSKPPKLQEVRATLAELTSGVVARTAATS